MPIALYSATSERKKIKFHQLNKETGNRTRYCKVDAETGDEVEQAARWRGRPAGVCRDPRSDPQGGNGCARESRVYDVIALEARGNGLMGITLRYLYEVRKQDEYFDAIEDEKVPKDMLELAMHIVDTKRGKFEPLKFEDEYEDALQELLKKKQKGEKIERAKEPARSNVINLMDALRQSVKSERGSGERRKPEKASARPPPKKLGPIRVTEKQADSDERLARPMS